MIKLVKVASLGESGYHDILCIPLVTLKKALDHPEVDLAIPEVTGRIMKETVQ